MNLPTDTFLQEAREILQSLEENLLELEQNAHDRSAVDAVFRGLHTIKGSGEMFGYSALASFTHHFENAYEKVRSGEATVTPDLVTLSLKVCDHISYFLDAGTDPDAVAAIAGSERQSDLLSRIEAFGGKAEEPATEEAAPAESAQMRHFRISFCPPENALRFGMRPDLLIEELRQLGQAEAVCRVGAVPPIEELDPTASYLAWQVVLKTEAGRGTIEDVFLFLDDADLEIEEIAVEVPGAGATVRADVQAEVAPQPERAGAGAPPSQTQAAKPQQAESIRVQASRLDNLMDQLGELVIAQSRLSRLTAQATDPGLSGAVEEIERLVIGLRDATLSIRMLPISTVFGKFRRVVRDLSSELEKPVRLEMEGGQTEVDKTIIDNLSEPLVHIIRNAIDHGVESAEERAARGKAPEAVLRLEATQAAGEVQINVSDDGGGLKSDAIRARALEKGLIDPETRYSDSEINQLIFAPGFSTASAVTSVSGRGVGMDAVRSVIERLRGAVEVQSEPGVGTRITLRLPLTLAIIDGLMISLGDTVFVLPLASVDECVEMPAETLARSSAQSILTLRDELIAFLRLEDLFGTASGATETRRVVIVASDGARTGLVVDDVIGQTQTVIKPLSPFHRGVPGLAGSTILGDGSVALIIDPLALIKNAGTILREVA